MTQPNLASEMALTITQSCNKQLNAMLYNALTARGDLTHCCLHSVARETKYVRHFKLLASPGVISDVYSEAADSLAGTFSICTVKTARQSCRADSMLHRTPASSRMLAAAAAARAVPWLL